MVNISLWYIMVGFYMYTKFAEKPQNAINLTILSYSLYTSIFYPLFLVTHLNALQNKLIKLKKSTVQMKL